MVFLYRRKAFWQNFRLRRAQFRRLRRGSSESPTSPTATAGRQRRRADLRALGPGRPLPLPQVGQRPVGPGCEAQHPPAPRSARPRRLLRSRRRLRDILRGADSYRRSAAACPHSAAAHPSRCTVHGRPVLRAPPRAADLHPAFEASALVPSPLGNLREPAYETQRRGSAAAPPSIERARRGRPARSSSRAARAPPSPPPPCPTPRCSRGPCSRCASGCPAE